MNSAVDVQNVLENFGAEILNTLNSVKKVLQECLVLNFIPTIFEELFAEKCGEGHLLNKIVVILCPPFLTSFCADILEMDVRGTTQNF